MCIGGVMMAVTRGGHWWYISVSIPQHPATAGQGVTPVYHFAGTMPADFHRHLTAY